jgi:cytochrome c556
MYELDRLDRRKPVPLLPMMANHQKQNMREHLAVVQEVVSATATRDFSKVAQAAQRIGYSEAMGQMCAHMGAGAPGFTEQALAFHHSADRIVDAAKREDSTGVLTALGDTLATCTACHAAYKQQIVDKLSE